MTSFAKEWQFDYEKARSTLQTLRETSSPPGWQVFEHSSVLSCLFQELDVTYTAVGKNSDSKYIQSTGW